MSDEISLSLAVIGKVIQIEAIPTADRLKLATVVCGPAGKWAGVVGLEFQPGENVLVLLPDAVVPQNSRWAFLERAKWRVKQQRFRGAPSEVVIVKLLPSEAEYPIGHDLSLALGVTRYVKDTELPYSLQGIQRGDFPAFIPRTDEPDYQVTERQYGTSWEALLRSEEFYVTLKYDGTSCTVWMDEGGLQVCSRNFELEKSDSVHWQMVSKYGLAEKLSIGQCLQMEIIGQSIQGNPCGILQNEIRIFSLRERTIRPSTGEPFYALSGFEKLKAFCKSNALPLAKVLDGSSLVGENASAQALRSLADQKYENGRPAEGIVVKGVSQHWGFKVINLEY